MRVRLFPLRLALAMVAAGCSDFAAPSTPAAADPKLPEIARVHTILPRLARRGRREPHALHPAEIAYLPAELAELFVLTEITHD